MGRNENIEQAAAGGFDAVIVGGGITGAGIFMKCCRKGWKTLLLDQGDFAGGTSSRSAKMIHGGLRYLQYMQVKLVREALEEREFLLENYPHLVRPLPFFLPIYGSRLEKVKLKVGLSGYDALAGHSRLPKHRSLSRSEAISRYPMLQPDGLKGGFYYFDAITNDARLTNEVIMEGCQLGGTAINYVQADLPESGSGSVGHLACTDMLTGNQFRIESENYIAAAGIWTDEFLKTGPGKPIMNPSKGVHIVVDGSRFPDKDVLLIPCTDDRFIWACPWENNLVLIGATDTPYAGGLREPGTTEADVRYLLDNTNCHLEGFQLTEDDILSVYSGLRPLLNDSGTSDTVKMSRDYKVWWDRDNLLAIAGGKLTSFLSMADHVLEKFGERAGTPDLPAAEKPKGSVELLADLASAGSAGAPEPTDGAVREQEIRFFVRYQHVMKIADVLSRRLSVSYGMKDFDSRLVEQVAHIMADELNWPADRTAAEIADYREHWELLHTWTKN